MSPVAERTLPHNLEAERSILGAIILNNAALNDAAAVIGSQDFFRDAHRRIFDHMCQMSVQGVPIDLVSLRESLGFTGDIDEVDGPAYLASLVDGALRSDNVEHYATIVKEKSRLRALVFTANKTLAHAYAGEDSAQHILEQAERAIFQIAEDHTSDGFVSSSSLMPGVMNRIEAAFQTKRNVTGVATGFTELDDMTRGLQPGNLILIAGRPSMGKTALACNIAEHVSGAGEQVVGIFSLEMSKDELMMREIAGVARVDSHRIQSGFLGERDWGRLSQAMGQLSNGRLFIDDTPNVGLFEMRARARRLKAEHGLHLLIIDYVQLMESHEQKSENRTLELGAISRGLKILARELAVPIVLLSQLSRAPELRSDHRPILSDLRESGSLEQDADVVAFVYRDEYYHRDRDDNKGIAEIIIAKQRNGPVGTVKLVFVKEYTKFENMAAASDRDDGFRQLPYGDR